MQRERVQVLWWKTEYSREKRSWSSVLFCKASNRPGRRDVPSSIASEIMRMMQHRNTSTCTRGYAETSIGLIARSGSTLRGQTQRRWLTDRHDSSGIVAAYREYLRRDSRRTTHERERATLFNREDASGQASRDDRESRVLWSSHLPHGWTSQLLLDRDLGILGCRRRCDSVDVSILSSRCSQR